MKKKLKDLVINDMFTLISGHTIYKVVMLFHSAKQLLAYDAANNRYCVFTIYDEDEVKLVVDECHMTGKDLCVADRFLWSDMVDNHIKTVVYATDEWITYKLTQDNGRTHYHVIYKGGRGWEDRITLCE